MAVKVSTTFPNVYSQVLEQYRNKYTVTFINPPSYLLSIIGKERARQKIVYIYKEHAFSFPLIKDLTPVKESNDLNITGSPLKDSSTTENPEAKPTVKKCFEPWTKEETKHVGISPEDVRSIINTEQFQLDLFEDDSNNSSTEGSVWFLCNGLDDHTLFYEHEFAKDYSGHGIVNYMGVIEAKDVNTQFVLDRHFKLLTLKNSLNTFIENTYLTQDLNSISCSWSTTVSTPALVEISASSVKLTQLFRLADRKLLTEDLINQLHILSIIREDIIAFKRTQHGDMIKEPVYRCGSGIDNKELQDEINTIISEISSFGIEDNDTDDSSDIQEVVQRAKLRTLTSFTDNLWDMLKRCSSYRDLRLAFNMLFQNVTRCNIVNTATSKTHLAEIIVEVANRRLAVPTLTGSEPLELLLEIGLEKLYKDYEYIFTQSKLCSPQMLIYKDEQSNDDDGQENATPSVRKSLHNAINPDINNANRKTLLHSNSKDCGKSQDNLNNAFKNSNFNERESGLRLGRLFQLHCTLEHLLMMHEFSNKAQLNLSTTYSDVCKNSLQRPPPEVDSIDDSWTDKMEIPLPMPSVREYLRGKEPYSRHIIMNSKNKLSELTTTFLLTMQNICPPKIAESLGIDGKNGAIISDGDEMETPKESKYYGWCYRMNKIFD